MGLLRINGVILFVFFTCVAWSQPAMQEAEMLMNKYKDENIVQLIDKTEYTIDIVKGKLVVFEERNARFLFLKNRMGNPFKQSVYTSEFHELESFEASTYIPNGKRYKEIKVDEYSQKGNSGSYSFYDDLVELSFTFPGVTRGAIVDFYTKTQITEPRLLNLVFLNNYYPVESFEVRFNCDANVKLDLIEFNTGDDEIGLQKETLKGRTMQYVQKQELPATIMEDNTPDIRYFIPHLIPIIRSYTYKGQTVEVLTDNASLYKWYHSFIAESKKGVDFSVLKELADSITINCTSDFERVETLYYWVQENIKYIAFEYGTGGFIPRKPDAILKNRYGDCKDKSSLLHELTNQLGIKTYFTWIGTNDLPYSYSDVSSPVSDNHMILTYIDSDSNYHFIDGTAKYHHINIPTSFIQGKEAMIGINDSVFVIKEVPTRGNSRNQWFDTVNLRMNDQQVLGEGSLDLTGYQYIEARYRSNSGDEEKIKKYYEGLLQKGNNKFKLTNYAVDPISEIDSSMRLNYTFELDSYMRQLENEFYINLNLNKELLDLKVKPDRKFPLSFDYLTKLNNVFILDIPEGYSVSSLPSNTSYSNEQFGFQIEYTQSDSSIQYSHEFYVNTTIIEIAAMEEWYELIKELELAYRQSILLVKNN